jgi:hypothetical protein
MLQMKLVDMPVVDNCPARTDVLYTGICAEEDQEYMEGSTKSTEQEASSSGSRQVAR